MLEEKLQYYKDNHLSREIKILDNKMINFSSNDYFGLAKAKKIKNSFIKGIKIYGFGSCSSPLISGYYPATQQLEQAFAKTLNKDEALFFNSGYHANIGIIQAFQCPIVMDKLCHASIIDGARLSGKKFSRYQHNDLTHAEKLLAENPNSLLISERVFSMEGDITQVEKLNILAKKYKATFLVDDAHGFGILPNNIKADWIITPLGKALGGMGAIVAGNKTTIDYLRQFTRSYMYSTALPPAIAYTNLSALKLMQEERWRLEKLKNLISLFNKLANEAKLNLLSNDLTPIRSILIEDCKAAKELEKKMYKLGFFIKAIVPPTVQTSRIRISLSVNHSKNDIINLIEAIECQ